MSNRDYLIARSARVEEEETNIFYPEARVDRNKYTALEKGRVWRIFIDNKTAC